MWMFLTRRAGLWLVGAVAAPLLGWALHRLRLHLERRAGGPTPLTRGLAVASRGLGRRDRGDAAAPVDTASHVHPVASAHADELAARNRRTIAGYEARHAGPGRS